MHINLMNNCGDLMTGVWGKLLRGIDTWSLLVFRAGNSVITISLYEYLGGPLILEFYVASRCGTFLRAGHLHVSHLSRHYLTTWSTLSYLVL